MWRQGTFSLAYLTVNGADPLEHIAAAAEAGYQAAGLRILQPRHLADAPVGCRQCSAHPGDQTRL